MWNETGANFQLITRSRSEGNRRTANGRERGTLPTSLRNGSRKVENWMIERRRPLLSSLSPLSFRPLFSLILATNFGSQPFPSFQRAPDDIFPFPPSFLLPLHPMFCSPFKGRMARRKRRRGKKLAEKKGEEELRMCKVSPPSPTLRTVFCMAPYYDKVKRKKPHQMKKLYLLECFSCAPWRSHIRTCFLTQAAHVEIK